MRQILPALVLCLLATSAFAQSREDKVRNDRRDVLAEGYWLYNDLPAGIERAKLTGKPMLVVLRCIPCESCHGMDLQVTNRDQAIRDLLDKFVCVRIVTANGLDLSLFQHDYDMSFGVYFLTADGTVLGRFGTRSTRDDTTPDISMEGLRRAMEGALELHKTAVLNPTALAGKRKALMDVERPEQLPSLTKYKSKLDYEGQVVQSCIHCHMIRDAQRQQVREAGQPLSDELLYPYPNPKVLGLVLDPHEKAVVAEVVPGSPAEKDGFRAGDELTTLANQPLLSIADVQWVLHTAPAPKETPVKLPAEIIRDGKKQTLALTLSGRWRKHDISWRPTTWQLRRMAGGMLLEDIADDERKQLNLPTDTMALRAKHVGQYGEHAVAKRAGFLKDDIVLAINGVSDRWTETDFLEQVTQHHQAGDPMTFKVRRGAKTLELSLKLQ